MHSFLYTLFTGGIQKMQKLITQLRILKEMNLKPNYSALAREYGCDRKKKKNIIMDIREVIKQEIKNLNLTNIL